MTDSEAMAILRASPDPMGTSTVSGPQKLIVNSVVRVFDEDADGRREVLYLDVDRQPMTAYLKGRTLLYIAEGF